MARKIVDPKTGARVADPSFTGMALSSGSTGSSWPEVRSQYQKGLRSAEFNRRGVPSELKNYLTGKTNKLSEDFDEPTISKGGDVRYTRTLKTIPKSDFDKKDKTVNTPMDKMPTKGANVPIPKGKLRNVSEKGDAPEFTNPSKVRTKTSAAMTGGKRGLTRATNPKGGLGAAKVRTDVKSPASSREGKLFKAYAGTTVTGDSHIGKSSTDIKSYKQDYKSQRKEYRKEGNIEGAKLTGMEVKQARQAQKFAARGESGKNKHYTDSNYRKTTGNTSRIAPDYKNSADNAANRNTMEAKLNAISAKPTNRTNMY